MGSKIFIQNFSISKWVIGLAKWYPYVGERKKESPWSSHKSYNKMKEITIIIINKIISFLTCYASF